MSGCTCEGLEGLELAICIAPPEGEYEVSIPLSRDKNIVLNRKGLFLKQVVVDDSLPFAITLSRPLHEDSLARMGVSIERLLCESARSLVDAASHGSVVAAEKLSACRDIVEKILSNCENST